MFNSDVCCDNLEWGYRVGGDSDKSEWVFRVLGFRVPNGQAAGVSEVWRDASAAVEARYRQFQQKVEAFDHPLSGRIAQLELAAMTGGLLAPLRSALLDLDGAAPEDGAARQAALRMVNETRSRLGQDPIVTALDENPFGVQLQMRSEMGAALDRMAAMLEAATQP